MEVTRLIEVESGDADRRIPVVPLRCNVLVADLKIALLSWPERSRGRQKQTLRIAQDHLVEWIVEFERDFNLLDAPIAPVFERTEHKCHFLVQEVGRAAHFRFEKMNLLGIGLLGRAHGQRLRHLLSRRARVTAEQDGGAQQQCHDDQSGREGSGKPAALF